VKLIVGLSGATGIIYGVRILEVLHKLPDIETHLVISQAAKEMIKQETSWTLAQVEALASYIHDNRDIGASISSGSFETEGMVIIPCSIKTMSSIAGSYNANLMTRAADVTLKEKRKLVLVVRETPLHLGHLRRMAELAEIGAVILPPMPAFYHYPKVIDDIINQTVGKVLDQFRIKHSLFERWKGLRTPVKSNDS
jgi:4-hydroxy-3-polyprenylbenzoate decarboxylase